jgi:hypothetical protein
VTATDLTVAVRYQQLAAARSAGATGLTET